MSINERFAQFSQSSALVQGVMHDFLRQQLKSRQLAGIWGFAHASGRGPARSPLGGVARPQTSCT